MLVSHRMMQRRMKKTRSIMEYHGQINQPNCCLYKEKKPLVEFGKIKTLKRMWQQIADKMNEFCYKFTEQKIETKWKSLERRFKGALENRNKTGRGRKRIKCDFEKEVFNSATMISELQRRNKLLEKILDKLTN